MHKLLLAEDDHNFSLMLKAFLEMNGFVITLCHNGQEALEVLQTQRFDACILDVMMPKLDGFSVAEKIQQQYRETPFVFLTAKSLKEDQIKGYQLGAVDYLVKPFDPEILLLKLRVLLQQTLKNTVDPHTLGSFRFDPTKRLLHLGDNTQKLSPKEAALLQLLLEKQGEVLTHEEALLKIWKNDDYFTKQSLNVFITKLRKYLAADPAYLIEIENLHSTGFILKCVGK
ncbi:response regulator transcription factor [Eisenibacter elegans]|jgi:DNA-binding response OmpR family regulator|uniref:response regulator transcription factor n=1 Tax=Eisenibacter elegans TaxID=997 RepID=UPI0004287EEC|nr:response regulator transcription factor [Eisenibacter elegans]